MEVLKQEIMDFIYEPISFLQIKFGKDFSKVIDENGFTLLHHVVFHKLNYNKTNKHYLLSLFQDFDYYNFDYNCFSSLYSTELLEVNVKDKKIYPSIISPIYFFLPLFSINEFSHMPLVEKLKPQFSSIHDQNGINAFFVSCYLKQEGFIYWAINNNIDLLNPVLYEQKEELNKYITSIFKPADYQAYNIRSFKDKIIDAINQEYDNKWEAFAEKKHLESLIADSRDVKKHKI